jgi:hypothetical protein
LVPGCRAASVRGMSRSGRPANGSRPFRGCGASIRSWKHRLCPVWAGRTMTRAGAALVTQAHAFGMRCASLLDGYGLGTSARAGPCPATAGGIRCGTGLRPGPGERSTKAIAMTGETVTGCSHGSGEGRALLPCASSFLC